MKGSCKIPDTHPSRDSFNPFGTERLKVHTYVPLHGSHQFLNGAVGRVCLLPPIALVPSGNDPLILIAKHVQVIGLEGTKVQKGFVAVFHGTLTQGTGANILTVYFVRVTNV